MSSTSSSRVPCRNLTSMELKESAPAPWSTNDTMVYPSISGLKRGQTAGATSPKSGLPGGRGDEEETLHATGPSLSAGSIEPELAKLLDEVRSIADHFRKQDANMAICKNWKFAALVIDRLCLVAFSVITILCTIWILMPASSFVWAVSNDQLNH